MEHYKQFLNDINEVLEYFPELNHIDRDGVPILLGSINLIAEDGEKLDRYEIEIHPPANYPNSYPLIYETGGRIPHNIDWHVYSDGHFCIAVPIQERLDCLDGINLKGFIQKQIMGFLFNQTFRRKNGYFYRERAHGLLGRLEFYKEYLKLEDIKAVSTSLRIIATGLELGSDSKCFCGENRKFKKCHRRILRDLEKKASNLVKNDFNEFKTMLLYKGDRK
ncbi:hypothetical protein F0919_08040 [Taibaiella lutea]|uniref:SEC-C domain-containing protein n=1 Tax=Taibaiella lutea TaxID=2608001 RepID=A0A5M6CKQ7_9BACT|nr:hypothetical protein [Taibaiella lutea]KAA5534562.1 hypothetical protein F0919_08040 [Taibaiella lutea]